MLTIAFWSPKVLAADLMPKMWLHLSSGTATQSKLDSVPNPFDLGGLHENVEETILPWWCVRSEGIREEMAPVLMTHLW